MKSVYLILLAAAISVTACRTKDGEPGPSGESALMKQGSVSGEITFLDEEEKQVKTSFNYEYFESLSDNKFYYDPQAYDIQGVFESMYQVKMSRRDLQDNNNYLSLNFEGDSLNKSPEESEGYASINLTVAKKIDNRLYVFDNGGNNFDITNFKIDSLNGRMVFDYSGILYFDNDEATVKGKVDVVLNRSGNNVLDLGRFASPE